MNQTILAKQLSIPNRAVFDMRRVATRRYRSIGVGVLMRSMGELLDSLVPVGLAGLIPSALSQLGADLQFPPKLGRRCRSFVSKTPTTLATS